MRVEAIRRWKHHCFREVYRKKDRGWDVSDFMTRFYPKSTLVVKSSRVVGSFAG